MANLKSAVAIAAPNTPLTASVYLSDKNSFTVNGWFDLQYSLGLDFHDYHPYYSFNGTLPAASDGAAIEARPKFIGRHLIGECGYGLDATTGKAAGTQTAFVAGMGATAQRGASLGSNYFSQSSYYAGSSTQASSTIRKPTDADPYGYGLFATDLSLTNAAIVSGLKSWPGGQL